MTALERYELLLAGEISNTHLADIQTHLPLLHEHAKGNILELGVGSGNSTTAFLAGLEKNGGFLWSFDNDSECGKLWKDHMLWEFINAKSVASSAVNLPYAFDVLFIDSWHTYRTVRSELKMYGDRSTKIFLHDVELKEVQMAVNEYLRSRPLRSYMIFEESIGSMGVIE